MQEPTVFIGVHAVIPGEVIKLQLITDTGRLAEFPIHRDALAPLVLALRNAALALPQAMSGVPIHCTELNAVQSDQHQGLEIVLQGLGSLFAPLDREQWKALSDASERALKMA